MTEEDKKKYNYMEPILTNINRSFISLSSAEEKRNNIILKQLVDLITGKMIEKSILFKEMYSRVFYGGSYYDGLRVGQPDEFDLDLLLHLPKILEPILSTSSKPGYVHLQFKELERFRKQQDLAERYKGLEKLINDKHFLDTLKVLRWMEGLVTQALNDFPKQGDSAILKTSHGQYYAKISKSGPAFTLKVKGNIANKDIVLDIDLVPCFIFGKDKWPVNGFRANPVATKPEFFIVPKPMKEPNTSHYWRLSFQEQERVIIDGKNNLKPALKLLKKMRDTQQNNCIASYYIKTIFLWQAMDRPQEFWNNSLSYVFMTMLKEYYNCLSLGKIPNFWSKNKSHNLIEELKKNESALTNMINKLKRIIANIEKYPNDPLIAAKYILTSEELSRLNTTVAT